MIDPNALVVKCMEANAYYNAQSEHNRHLSSEAWLDSEHWLGKAYMYHVLAEVYLMRAEELTKP